MKNPLPEQIRAIRIDVGLTQKEAGKIIQASMRSWQDYESGARKMHPGLWELFRVKVGKLKLGIPNRVLLGRRII
jgi:putative transcriptional regulator